MIRLSIPDMSCGRCEKTNREAVQEVGQDARLRSTSTLNQLADRDRWRCGITRRKEKGMDSWRELRVMVFMTLFASAPLAAAQAESMPVHELKQHTHIHGLAVDRVNEGHLLIATHHGVFRADPKGMAERISPVKDFMGFTPHPDKPEVFYGSGHPPQAGNLGFIVSTDGGVSWQQRSPGVNGPVDFHQMTVSPVDPDVIYGTYGTLQRSDDGGQSWSIVGPLPDELISLAASAMDVDTLYAGTRNGLEISRDGGLNWQSVLDGFTVSLVAVPGDGGLYAFVPGHGLVHADETALDFTTLAGGWADHIVLHMAFDPEDPSRIFAASHQSVIFASEDGGRSWSTFTRVAD